MTNCCRIKTENKALNAVNTLHCTKTNKNESEISQWRLLCLPQVLLGPLIKGMLQKRAIFHKKWGLGLSVETRVPKKALKYFKQNY